MLIMYLGAIDTESDRIKFEQIYKKYNGLVYYIALKMLKGNAEAEDAMQETFLRLTKHLDKFDDISSHKTKRYIVIVVENICRDVLKRRKKHPMLSFDEAIHVEPTFNQAEENILEKASAELIRTAMSELPSIYRDVIILRYVDELSDNEISRLLKISAAAVRKRLQRARQMLAAALNEKEVIYLEDK